MTTIVLSQRGRAAGTSTPKRSPNRSWLASERIRALLTTSQRSTLSVELVHADSWKGRSSVVLGLILVYLVDGNGGVYNGRLNSLLLDDGLDVLVDVVVNVLTSDGGGGSAGVLGLIDFTSILELGTLGFEALLYVVLVAVLDVAVLDTCHLVGVLLWENLLVGDGLDRGVVVVLVNFTVDGGGNIFVSGWGDGLVGDGWVYGLEIVRISRLRMGRRIYLVDSGVMLSILVEEVTNSSLCLVHCD